MTEPILAISIFVAAIYIMLTVWADTLEYAQLPGATLLKFFERLFWKLMWAWYGLAIILILVVGKIQPW